MLVTVSYLLCHQNNNSDLQYLKDWVLKSFDRILYLSNKLYSLKFLFRVVKSLSKVPLLALRAKSTITSRLFTPITIFLYIYYRSQGNTANVKKNCLLHYERFSSSRWDMIYLKHFQICSSYELLYLFNVSGTGRVSWTKNEFTD